MITEGWHLDAACAKKDVNRDMFYPDVRGKANRRLITRKAVDICVHCPVHNACFESALKSNEQWGIWGGVDMERYRLGQRTYEAEAINTYASG